MLYPASVGTRELDPRADRGEERKAGSRQEQSSGPATHRAEPGPLVGRQPSTPRRPERERTLLQVSHHYLKQTTCASGTLEAGKATLLELNHCVDIYPRGSSAVSTIWGTMHRGTDPTKNLEGEGDGSSSWDPPYILKPSRALKLAWLAGKRLRRNLLYSGFGGLLDALIGRLITAFTAGIQDLPNPEAEPDLEGGGDEEDH